MSVAPLVASLATHIPNNANPKTPAQPPEKARAAATLPRQKIEASPF